MRQRCWNESDTAGTPWRKQYFLVDPHTGLEYQWSIIRVKGAFWIMRETGAERRTPRSELAKGRAVATDFPTLAEAKWAYEMAVSSDEVPLI